MVSPSGMIGFFGAASYHACHCEEAVRRGPQGSAACGLRATAASGGGKGAKKLGSHLDLRKQRAAQSLSGNPEESSDRSVKAGTCLCTNEVQGKDLVPTRKSPGTNGREISAERYFPEIATAPSGPRNDIVGGTCPQRCHCEEAKPTWQSVCLLAVIFYEEVPARGTDCHGFFEASQ